MTNAASARQFKGRTQLKSTIPRERKGIRRPSNPRRKPVPKRKACKQKTLSVTIKRPERNALHLYNKPQGHHSVGTAIRKITQNHPAPLPPAERKVPENKTYKLQTKREKIPPPSCLRTTQKNFQNNAQKFRAKTQERRRPASEPRNSHLNSNQKTQIIKASPQPNSNIQRDLTSFQKVGAKAKGIQLHHWSESVPGR